MMNPEALKHLLEEAHEEVKNWPDWMKNQDQAAENAPKDISEGEISDAA
jgi:hypothetical protein